jgi:high-affinity Fe2+/Pb2+ permease
MALIMLSVAIAYFIHWNGDGLALHWSFLIVFGFYLLVAALLALIGIRKVKKVRAPERAIAQANEAKQILSRGSSGTA